MSCGNKEHELHACGVCEHWTIDVYINPKEMTEKCKICKNGDCQFEKSDKYR